MADASKGYYYGIRDIKITSLDGTTQVDLPVARKLLWKPEYISSSLDGDDQTVATIAFIKKFTFELESGGLSLEALAMLTGKTVTVSGSSPNTQESIQLNAGDNAPYVKIYGKALGDGNDGVHILIRKAKMIELEAPNELETWTLTKGSGEAVNDDNGVGIEIIKLETLTDLPTS